MRPSEDRPTGGQHGLRPAAPTFDTLAVPATVAQAAGSVADVVHDRVAGTMTEIKPRLHGWLHAVTAPLAFLSCLAILVTADSTRARIGVSVFMISTLLLFTTSAIYHTGTWRPATCGS
ncbi:MAG: DNA-binding protein [Aeromicrobium sp.]|jgi:hypothetical protein|nr:DNA-binding protein [Aeromicrobium sp.]